MKRGAQAEAQGQMGDAEQSYRQALALDPAHARGHFALGNLHAMRYEFDLARTAYLRALELQPDFAGVWGNLGNIEKYLGHFTQAFACYRRAIEHEADPRQQARRHSNLLLALHYDEGLSHDELYRAHVEWAERYARHLYPARRVAKNNTDGLRRLRIGYVSGGFCENDIAEHFLRSVLARHDPSQFEIIVYAKSRAGMAQSPKLRALVRHWVDIEPMGDAAVAARIGADGLDIAIDLDGHNPTGSLLAFARGLAPVQIEWLDWFDTSGVATLDYILTDPWTTPVDSPQRFSETPARLPHSRFCYSPVEYAPPVAATPVGAGRPLTFGSFNRQDKLHPRLYGIWAEILHAVPDSRLLLKNRALQIAAIRDGVITHFTQLGIAHERLVLRGPSPHADMLQEYSDIDICLDTFPYNGGLTTCECLWMGVPIVALEAERMIGRQTSAMLRVLGLDDWVATSPVGYVRLAVAKGTLRDEVESLRATLRQRLAASPICDAARFTRDLESVYRALWQRYCAAA